MERRIAPSFQTPKNSAAVSGVAGRTTATRSPRPTPCAASVCAAALARSWSSPQLRSRVAPSKLSHTIAGFSRGCLSQTSAAMLYCGGTSQQCAAHISSYVMGAAIIAGLPGPARSAGPTPAIHDNAQAPTTARRHRTHRATAPSCLSLASTCLRVRPSSRGGELSRLSPCPNGNRLLALAAEGQFGSVLHVVRAEALELALAEAPIEPDQEPVRDRIRWLHRPRLMVRRGQRSSVVVGDFTCTREQRLPPERTGVPVLVFGHLAGTEPAGCRAPLAAAAATELDRRQRQRRHLVRERPRERDLCGTLERRHQVGKGLCRLGVRHPRFLLRVAGNLDLRTHDAVCLDPTWPVLARAADHAERDQLDDPAAVQREVRREMALEDAQTGPETALDRVQDADCRRLQVDRHPRMRARDVFDLATTDCGGQKPLLHRLPPVCGPTIHGATGRRQSWCDESRIFGQKVK